MRHSKATIRRYEGIIAALPKEIKDHGSTNAALGCLGLTFCDDIGDFEAYLTVNNPMFLDYLAKHGFGPRWANATPTERFIKWMHGRGGVYATLELKHYTDGEPYFSSQGAEMSLSDFLRREEKLTG